MVEESIFDNGKDNRSNKGDSQEAEAYDKRKSIEIKNVEGEDKQVRKDSNLPARTPEKVIIPATGKQPETQEKTEEDEGANTGHHPSSKTTMKIPEVQQSSKIMETLEGVIIKDQIQEREKVIDGQVNLIGPDIVRGIEKDFSNTINLSGTDTLKRLDNEMGSEASSSGPSTNDLNKKENKEDDKEFGKAKSKEKMKLKKKAMIGKQL
ncbi:hypothetical protein L6452_35854 [Arctium lappa]|uniref:Uncharacterized protein n=1 Tax=Arctium lappa TaxID=4217 RepID=A0ACB8Y6W5_ARCLA|nr:hypothetical protein L6452_35854 [Arctium lappa]